MNQRKAWYFWFYCKWQIMRNSQRQQVKEKMSNLSEPKGYFGDDVGFRSREPNSNFPTSLVHIYKKAVRDLTVNTTWYAGALVEST